VSLLVVDNLSVAFGKYEQKTQVVSRVSFEMREGEKLALVGESGSGKSVTAFSILQLHDRSQVSYPEGKIEFNGQNLLEYDEAQMCNIRGKDIAMIFQEPMTSLNPVYPIGKQLIEPLVLHEKLSKELARKRAIELLDLTGIPEPGKRIDAFPHMMSGGQRQRVMIAMALACSPKLLIADEPTTALDVTVQLQILNLLEDLQKDFSMAVLMITHDLNMVRRFAERVCVMQKGELVEQGEMQPLFDNPKHPYTIHLLNSQPEKMISGTLDVENQTSLLKADNIRCYFPIKGGFFRKTIGEIKAVDNISLDLQHGETLGIVGESGSGKSTLGMCLLRLQNSEGQINFNGKRLDQLSTREIRPLRSNFQVVFQDPFSSLSPRMTVEQIVVEGLRIHAPQLTLEQQYQKVVKAMKEVGLEEDMLWRYPHEFSGGQRQRIAIARVIILKPKLILLDEPTSALDVSVQKQVLEILKGLQEKRNISYLFITHDLKVIRAMAHRIIVMKDGQVVEHGDTDQLFSNPQQSYTKDLLHASLFVE